MWAVPLRDHDGITCSVGPLQRAIRHTLLAMKDISIPVQMGEFKVRTVKFMYYPDAEATRFVLLECDCKLNRGFGRLLPIQDFGLATYMFTPAETVCVDEKIHLLKGVMGPNSFFVFKYNPRSNIYYVLAHIIVT